MVDERSPFRIVLDSLERRKLRVMAIELKSNYPPTFVVLVAKPGDEEFVTWLATVHQPHPDRPMDTVEVATYWGHYTRNIHEAIDDFHKRAA